MIIDKKKSGLNEYKEAHCLRFGTRLVEKVGDDGGARNLILIPMGMREIRGRIQFNARRNGRKWNPSDRRQ